MYLFALCSHSSGGTFSVGNSKTFTNVRQKEQKSRRKKTKGRKRHIATDTMGNLLCVHVRAANIHDTKGGVYTFEKALFRCPAIIAVHADQGYRGTFKNTFEVQLLRWKAERTLAWFQSSRRLSKDYEIKTVYAETMCIISHFHTLLRRFGAVGGLRSHLTASRRKCGQPDNFP